MSPLNGNPGMLPSIPHTDWFMLSVHVNQDATDPFLDHESHDLHARFVRDHCHWGLYGSWVTKIRTLPNKGNKELKLLFKEEERLNLFRVYCKSRFRCLDHVTPDVQGNPGSLVEYHTLFDLMFLSLVLETNHPLREGLWRRIPPPLLHSFSSQLGPIPTLQSSLCRPYIVALDEVDEKILGELDDDMDAVWVWFVLRSIYCYNADPQKGRARFKIDLRAFIFPHTPLHRICTLLCRNRLDRLEPERGPESISLSSGTHGRRKWIVRLCI